MIALNQGDVIAIRFLWGEHWGIVANDDYGRLTIISNRRDKGGVTEELWEHVVGTATWRVVNNLATSRPAYMLVAQARSMLGSRYDFWKWNCQDLVYWALGLQPQSPQREAAVGLLAFATIGLMMTVTTKSA
jgi:hypothetical protein